MRLSGLHSKYDWGVLPDLALSEVGIGEWNGWLLLDGTLKDAGIGHERALEKVLGQSIKYDAVRVAVDEGYIRIYLLNGGVGISFTTISKDQKTSLRIMAPKLKDYVLCWTRYASGGKIIDYGTKWVNLCA